MAVPLFANSLDEYMPRLTERLAEAARAGQYILGPQVEAFESEFADYLGARHAIGVANGTEAISIGLRAVGVEAGDDVVVPSFTFYASAEAVAAIGARPVFCDVDPETFLVTPETVKAALTPKTKAIVAVHLFGNLAPIAALLELGLPVLEDSAQATGATLDGARAGALGTLATFSFYPSKNLPCLGDGGAITTNDDAVAEQARILRFHGSKDKRTYTDVGYNSRLDELQATVLRELLPHLDGWNAARRGVADAYERHGLGEHVGLPVPTPGAEHVHHLYVVRHERADELAAALSERGVAAAGYYRTPIHRQPALATDVELPGTEQAARTHLALPMGTQLTDEQVREVVDACASGST
jgi:dTDP-3-amino-3,4,6-trideoxy-alpha-D-glucose transaminase